VYRGVFGLAALALGYSLFESPFGAMAFAAFVGVSATLGGIIGERIQIALRARRFAKRCLPKYGSIAFLADADGVHLRNGDTEVRHTWSAFDGWVETAEFFLILWPGAGGYYLPKSAIPDQRRDQWRSLLATSLPGSAPSDLGGGLSTE
jgi:hypothetical protein